MSLPTEASIVKAVLCVGIAALLWLICIVAFARPMSKDECRSVASDMYVIAQMRDQGKDRAEVEALIDRVLRPHLGEPDSYIMYETDITEMVNMVAIIYESKMTPTEIGNAAYGVCTLHGYGVKYST